MKYLTTLTFEVIYEDATPAQIKDELNELLKSTADRDDGRMLSAKVTDENGEVVIEYSAPDETIG